MKYTRWFFVSLALLLAVSFAAPQLPAQTQTTGDITGVVTDQTGAVVPQTKVNLKDNSKGNTQDTTTGRDGTYRFFLLPPGSYTMTVSAVGLQTVSRPVDVNIGQVATIDVQLSVASSNTVVTVTEAAPLIQPENGNVATTISEQQVEQVPNPGNDMSYIAQTAPGVVMNTSGGFGNFAAYGIGATSNLFTIDGMDDNDPFLNLNNSGATNLLLGANEVQEATVVSNGYSGEYGSLAGSSINYITKSGGNDFHGNAIYYWNGRTMNANDWFLNDAGQGRNFVNANQWAGSLGGPIKRDKAFFFFNTEGLRVLIPTTTQVTYPSAAFQTATIANLDKLFGPTSQTVAFYNQIFNLYNNAPGAKNAQLGSFPGDTSNGCFGQTVVGLPSGTNCSQFFQSGLSNLTHEYQVAGRVDYNIGNNDRAFVRVLYDHGVQATFTDPINTVFNTSSDQPQWQGQLNETHTFGATMTNQFILSGAWYSAIFNNPNRAAALAAFPTTLSFPFGGIPWTPVGGGEFNEGDALNPSGRRVSQYQASDDVSKTWGKHTFKVGTKFRRNDVTDVDFGQLTSGLLFPLSLSAFFDGGNIPKTSNTSELVQSFPTSPVQPFALYTLAFYGEDDWKVRQNLTLTFALRAEHQSNPVCNTNCFSRLNEPFLQANNNPATPYSTDISVGLNQMLQGTPAIVLQPRFGFAWQPLGWHNTVVRGGIGIFNDAFPGVFVDDFAGNPPNVNTFTVAGNNLTPGETLNGGNLFTDASNNNTLLRNAFANNQTLGDIRAINPLFTPPNLFSADRRSRLPQYQKWNLDIQQQVGANTSFAVSYNGNHGIYELINRNGVNGFGFGSLPAAPFDPRFNIVNLLTNSAVSNYNGVTFSFKQRIHGWGSGVFQANYTYSHAFDEVSNAGLVQVPFTLQAISATQDPFNLRSNYGPADYDVRHYFNANYVWELPVRRALFGHGYAALVDGWQVSGTIFARTGLPFTVIDAALDGALGNQGYGGAVFPQFLGGPIASCGEGAAGTAPNPCFPSQTIPNPLAGQMGQPATIPNPKAQFVQFGSETGFTPGLRNAFRGPDYFDTDFTVIKNTKIPHWEKGELGIGFQFFNLFNHPNFAAPNNDISSGNFGHVFSLVSVPTSILGSFLGADAAPRLIQLKAQLRF